MPQRSSLADIPGWLSQVDELLFEWILTWQSKTGRSGDVVELGVYRGRSAIHIGRWVDDDERFTVCDLFEETQSSDVVPPHIKAAYAALTQASFEDNYLRFHTRLPTIVRGPTSVITDHVEPDTCRFVHIDASHLYADVRTDTLAARTVLGTDGVVVFDDYRNARTAGTAAAVWEAVATEGLRPICVSDAKLYATWGDPGPVQTEIISRLDRHRSFHAQYLLIRDQTVIRATRTALPPSAYGPPSDATVDANSTTARVLATAGRSLSHLGYRATRLAQAERPLATAGRAGVRRLRLLRDRLRDALSRS